MIPIEYLLVGTAVFLCLSIAASKLASRFGIPALLLFLLIGMLAGADGPGGIYFDNPWLAQAVGVVALAIILFSGGLDTRLDDVRPVFRRGLVLSTLGVSITALAVGWFASTFLGFRFLEGVLLGAIISSTDAAAVLTLLRGKGVNLKGSLKPLLEFESGSNDPMAVFLTIGMIQLVQQPQMTVLNLIPFFIQQMVLGGLLGFLLGRGVVFIINRAHLEYDGLYSVLVLALVLLIYGVTASLGGNGFLAAYLAGLVIGNRDFIHQRSLRRFMDGIAWLMQIVMFLTLGLQVFPSELPQVAPVGLLIAVFLILVARPVSVLISLAFARMRWRERIFVAWVGLRGAAPIILATFPLVAGLEQADLIFNLVFFIVLTSVLFQGTLIVPAARLLGVEAAPTDPLQSPLALTMGEEEIANDLMEIVIPDDGAAVGKQILDLRLPPGALIVLIGRRGERVVPNGGTTLEAGDHLLLLAPRQLQDSLRKKFDQRTGVPD